MLKFDLSFSFCLFAALTQNATLQLSSGLPVGNSPGSKPGATVVVERVYIHGLSRFKSLGKFAHSFKVKVLPLPTDSNVRLPNIEVCFHRWVFVLEYIIHCTCVWCMNLSTYQLGSYCVFSWWVIMTEQSLIFCFMHLVIQGLTLCSISICHLSNCYWKNNHCIWFKTFLYVFLFRNVSLVAGMCSHSQWEKVAKGAWTRSVSPFDHKILDIRTAGSTLENFEVSVEEGKMFLVQVCLSFFFEDFFFFLLNLCLEGGIK